MPHLTSRVLGSISDPQTRADVEAKAQTAFFRKASGRRISFSGDPDAQFVQARLRELGATPSGRRALAQGVRIAEFQRGRTELERIFPTREGEELAPVVRRRIEALPPSVRQLTGIAAARARGEIVSIQEIRAQELAAQTRRADAEGTALPEEIPPEDLSPGFAPSRAVRRPRRGQDFDVLGSFQPVTPAEAIRFRGRPEEAFTVPIADRDLFGAVGAGVITAELGAGVTRATPQLTRGLAVGGIVPLGVPTTTEAARAAAAREDIIQFTQARAAQRQEVGAVTREFRADPEAFVGRPGVETTPEAVTLTPAFFGDLPASRRVGAFFGAEGQFLRTDPGRFARPTFRSEAAGFVVGLQQVGLGIAEGTPSLLVGAGVRDPTRPAPGFEIPGAFPTAIRQAPIGRAEFAGIVAGGGAAFLPLGVATAGILRAEGLGAGGARLAREFSIIQPRGVFGREFAAQRVGALERAEFDILGARRVRTGAEFQEIAVTATRRVPGGRQFVEQTVRIPRAARPSADVPITILRGSAETRIVNPFTGEVTQVGVPFAGGATVSPARLRAGEIPGTEFFQGAGDVLTFPGGVPISRGFRFGGATTPRQIDTALFGVPRVAGAPGRVIPTTELQTFRPTAVRTIFGTDTALVGVPGVGIVPSRPITTVLRGVRAGRGFIFDIGVAPGVSGPSLGRVVRRTGRPRPPLVSRPVTPGEITASNLAQSLSQISQNIGVSGARGAATITGTGQVTLPRITTVAPVRPRVATGISAAQVLGTPTRQAISPALAAATAQRITPVQISPTIVSTAVIPALGSGIAQIPATTTPTITITPTTTLPPTVPGFVPITPIIPFVPITPFVLPGLTPPPLFVDEPARRVRGRQPQRRVPSLVAAVFGITAEAPVPGEITGLITRPLIRRRRRRRPVRAPPTKKKKKKKRR